DRSVLVEQDVHVLDCEVFLNYLVDQHTGRLHLVACSGIPDGEKHIIEWLDYGVSASGYAARDFCHIVSENVGDSSDPRTELVRSYGIRAYACHPLAVRNRVIGTLSFGASNRTRFTDDELSLMKAVADQVAIAMDRMQSGEALRESEIRYRGLFDHMIEGFAYCRMLFEDDVAQDFIYLAVNDAFEKLTGLKDVVGKRVTEVIPGIRESDTGLFQIYGNVVKSGEPARVEIFVEALGLWFDISVYSPEKECFVAVFDVITERKRAEALLRKSEERYERIAATVPAVLYDYTLYPDGTSQFLYLSPRCSEIFGLGSEALLKDMNLFWSMIHPEDLAKLQWENIKTHGEWNPFSDEVRILTPSGRMKWIQLTARPNSKGPEEAIVWSGVILDITDHRRAEEEREKAERLESLGVLAGGIAHDFNNILTAIIGNISLARKNVGEEHTATPQLASCEKALVKATALARQLLTFARGGAPMIEIVDTVRLICDVVSFALHGSNSKADLDLEQGLWNLNADVGQIHQALNNLIINALQAMPHGGTIIIKATNDFIDSKEEHNIPAGNYVKITVIDHGCGITPEFLGKIFDPYFTTKPSGTGLGLASVFSIIKRHGGAIEVSSIPGKGSSFTILLPAAGEKSVEGRLADEPGDTVYAPISGLSVLVMDDEDMIRELVAEMLVTLGYKGFACADGAKAVNLYKEHWARGEPFAAVILDMTVPGGMGGKEAAEQILNIDPGAILIISSGYAAETDLTLGTNAFFRGVVSKPYNLQKLSQELARLIKLR
ncbi:MAG: ATP-binding protein, partial [Dehalococcoidia bacterium]